MRIINQFRLFKNILVWTKVYKFLISFILFTLIDALFIMIVDPNIKTYGDSLWYCYATITTTGFGDVIVTSLAAKLASVILSIYAVMAIAVITGVVVNFCTQTIEKRNKETLAGLLHQLEFLPEMSKEELEDLSQKVKNLEKNLRRNNKND